jgi:hypothetical protein
MANLFYQVANRSIELALDARCPTSEAGAELAQKDCKSSALKRFALDLHSPSM